MMMYDLAPCNIISIWRSEILYNSIKSSLINILVYGTYYVPTSNNKMFSTNFPITSKIQCIENMSRVLPEFLAFTSI